MAFDCKLSRSAIIAIYDYQNKMAQGALMASYTVPENEWVYEDQPPISMAARDIETVFKESQTGLGLR